MSVLDAFHPAVRAWFERRFPLGPTEPQALGWPAIAGGEDTLIAAPTGSGKTLAAFLVMIDRLLRERADAVAGEEAHRGRLRLAAQGARRGHPAEPRDTAGGDPRDRRRDGARRARAARAPAHGRHAVLRAGRHDQAPAASARHHARVALPARDLREEPRAAALRAGGDRGRDPRGGARQAGRASGADARAAGRALRAAAAAHRPLRHPAPDRGHRPPARRGGGWADAGRRRPGVPGDRPRASPGPRPGPRSAADPARGRRVARAVGRDPRPDRGARRRAPHHAGLRQYPPARRAARPSARRARGRGPRGGPSRQPLQGPAAQAGGAAPGGGPEGPRGDGLARAGHRHRPRRARLPDRLAPEPRDVPAAGRPLRPRAGRHAQGPPLSDHARRAGRERGAPARRARGPPRPCPPAGGAARHPRPADRGRLRERGLVRGRSLRARAPGRALCRPAPRGLRRRGRDARGGHPDRAAAGGAPGSIATW